MSHAPQESPLGRITGTEPAPVMVTITPDPALVALVRAARAQANHLVTTFPPYKPGESPSELIIEALKPYADII